MTGDNSIRDIVMGAPLFSPLPQAGRDDGHEEVTPVRVRPQAQAPTRVWGDRAVAATLWADCLPLARGVPQGLAYLRRVGAPLPDEPTDGNMRLYRRLRVGVMPREHVGANGTVHDLGRWPCLLAAYGARGCRGLLRIWLDVDGRSQSRLPDPDMPTRALSPYELIGEVEGEAIHFGDMREGAAVAVTLECALAALVDAPGSVWAVDALPAAGKLDLPQGLRRAYLVVWRVLIAGQRTDEAGQRWLEWTPPPRREAEICNVAWHLSANGARELLRVDLPMPCGWSPIPGIPSQMRDDQADLERFENEGGAL